MSNLEKIDHIIVLMLENRSFDHMLGYLSLTGRMRDIDGLTGSESNDDSSGNVHEVFHLSSTRFRDDPGHNSGHVAEQLDRGNRGFVRNFETRRKHEDIGAVMGYYDGNDLPVYDFFASQFVVCDRWFCSVPGPTWPNRLFSLAGNSNGEKDPPPLLSLPFLEAVKAAEDLALLEAGEAAAVEAQIMEALEDAEAVINLPRYRMKTIFEYLEESGASWNYFSHDFAFLRLFRRYFLMGKIPFRTKRILKINKFFEMVERGSLPDVSWIDPNFEDIPSLPGSVGSENDDHPPADVRGGQELVGRIYNALQRGGKELWSKTLLVITYDEHGGFFDHVEPPPAVDDLPDVFPRLGVRVPAFVISPWVAPSHADHTVYDHTSILKTILMRFCRGRDGTLPDMGKRVNSANDLGPLLTESSPRPNLPEAPRVILEPPEEALVLGQEPNDLQLMIRHMSAAAVLAGVPVADL